MQRILKYRLVIIGLGVLGLTWFTLFLLILLGII